MMRVISVATIKALWEDYPEHLDAKEPGIAWYRYVKKADWPGPAAVKEDFGNASILKDGRAVFNIAGNKYRLVVWINYPHRVVYVRFFNTHEAYDKINAQPI